jgi:hypothetical protein
LLSLCRKTDHDRFEKACELALKTENFSYKFIKSLIESKYLQTEGEEEYKPLPFPENNIRGKQYYE